MKIPLNSFYHMLNSQKRRKIKVLSSFIMDFTEENVPMWERYYDTRTVMQSIKIQN